MGPEFSIAKHEAQATLSPLAISIAFNMTDAKSEGEALGKRLEGMNKAALARDYKIPGGPSMISQNISGNRPISLEAAIAYAKALKCTLSDISPRLATLVSSAASIELGEVARPETPLPSLDAALQAIALACSRVPVSTRDNVSELLALVVKNPEANAEDQIPIISRKLSGESNLRTGTHS